MERNVVIGTVRAKHFGRNVEEVVVALRRLFARDVFRGCGVSITRANTLRNLVTSARAVLLLLLSLLPAEYITHLVVRGRAKSERSEP